MIHRFLRHILFSCILLLFAPSLFAKPLPITQKETKGKIEEILKAHVCHHVLTKELIERAFSNFLEEIDPNKIYLLNSEVAPWKHPTEELLEKTLVDYQEGNFFSFYEIYALMIHGIERRQRLEKEIAKATLPERVTSAEFKDLQWAGSKEELQERILRLKSLQAKVAEKVVTQEKEQFLKRLEKRRNLREAKFLDGEEKEQLVLVHVLKAISSALDSQTLYLTPNEATALMMQVQQKLYGIGAQLRDDLDGLTIVRFLEGGPASRHSKLKEGDKIIVVNHEPVLGMEIEEAVSLIRGPIGSKVLLTMIRGERTSEGKSEEPFDVEITRGEIVLEDSRVETTLEPYGDGMIAIAHLFSFYHDGKNSSASDLAAAIQSVKQKYSLKGIILDLRNNGGGQLQQAVAVTGLFISPGVVVSVKDNTEKLQKLRHAENSKIWSGPLIVLTNRLSASAAEIVAQTLQEYGRAIVVGDPETFGKGTFQSFTLEAASYGKVNPKGEYKVTRGWYYTVSGKSPQLVGVRPHIIAPGPFAEMEIGEKYAKYPVGTDEISASFEDDLSDLPPLYRIQLQHYYHKQKQTIEKTYETYIEQLRKNSSLRIEQNTDYKAFLSEIAKKRGGDEEGANTSQSDLQLQESLNVMKDLLFMLQSTASEKSAA